MPFVSLLKEWSALEPHKCSYAGGIFSLRGWTLTNENEISERLTNAEIQCAIQEAIESHGWYWFLGRVRIEDGEYYKCRIAIPVADDGPPAPRLNTFLSTHSTAYVLLQAYLQALKATNAYLLARKTKENEAREPVESAGAPAAITRTQTPRPEEQLQG